MNDLAGITRGLLRWFLAAELRRSIISRNTAPVNHLAVLAVVATATGERVLPITKACPQLLHQAGFLAGVFLSRSLVDHEHDTIFILVYIVGDRRLLHLMLLVLATAGSEVRIGVLVSGPARRRLRLRDVVTARLLLDLATHRVVEALQEAVYAARILCQAALLLVVSVGRWWRILRSVVTKRWTIVCHAHEAATSLLPSQLLLLLVWDD